MHSTNRHMSGTVQHRNVAINIKIIQLSISIKPRRWDGEAKWEISLKNSQLTDSQEARFFCQKKTKKNRLWVFKIILWQWPYGLEAWKSDNVDQNIWILLSSTHSSSVLILQGSKVLIFGTYYTIYGWSLKLFTRKWKEMKKTDFKTNSDELLQTWLKLLYRICCHDGLLYKLWSIAVV